MKNHALHASFTRFSVFLWLLFAFSCKKETPTDYTRFPIELTTADVLNGIKLTWSKVETSDFIDYTIVRSTGDSIPELSQLAGNPSAAVVTRITESKLTTFTDFRNSTGPNRTHYRVFARLSGRNLSSRNVLTNADVLDLGGSFNEIVFNNDPKNPIFYMAGNNSTLLSSYSANEDRVVTTNSGLSTTGMRLAVANKNGANEEVAAFSSSNSGTVNFLDAKTLASIRSIGLTNGSAVVAASGTSDGFFIFVTNETVNNVKIVSIATHTIVSQASISFTYSVLTGSILVKNPSQREFVLRDPTISSQVRVSRIEYNEQGQILGGGFVGVAATGFTTSIPVLRVSTTGDTLLVNNLICNRSLQTRATLTSPSGFSYADLMFSPQSDKVYGFTGSTASASVDEYAAASFKLNRSISSKLSGWRCFAVNNALILFSNPNTTGRSFVQKIKI